MADENPGPVKNLTIDQSTSPSKINDPETQLLKEKVDEWLKRQFNLPEFPQLLEAINSKDRFKEVYGTIGLRKILSEQNPPIQAVIDANLVPKLISFMQKTNEPHLQLEAAWSLTNVASGTTQQTQTIIDQGGIPCFIQLLRSSHHDIAEQGVWAIGNIAGDSASFRDLILKLGGLEPLLNLVNQSTNRVIIKHGTWAISNLCRGKPLPKFELVKSAIPTLCKIVQIENDTDILTDATWALSYLSHEKPGIAHELAKELIPVLIKHLDAPNASLSIPCLRTLGNITEDDAEQNIALAHPSYLPKLFQLTCNRGKAVRRETCWLLSNLAAGDSSQVEALIKNPYYVDMLIKMSSTDALEVQREVCYVFSNATKHSTSKQLAYLIELGVMDCLLRLIGSTDAKTVEVAAHGILNMLNTGSFVSIGNGKKKNEFAEILEQKGGIKKIEDLQTHPNDDIYNVAYGILEKHFELESLAEID